MKVHTESGSVYHFDGNNCDCWRDDKIERQFTECKILRCAIGLPLQFSRRKIGLPADSFGITETTPVTEVEDDA